MGEAFLAAKKERFNHQRDKAVEDQLKGENLFSALPDIHTALYRCALKDDTNYQPEVGDGVVVSVLERQFARVSHKNEIIGHVIAPDARKLIESLSRTNLLMLASTVHTVSELTRTFTISIDPPTT